ncbi:L-ascorbate peroxidase 3-like [Lycium barbarum]|uniref:L-ascorbate peroxidase 3-like n=1 Tax=Lycium barbarum TaxID=112863 RepID=UPI00293E99A3|nr:L-ascorbate peroxidase 3-like [Lycium barbarum]
MLFVLRFVYILGLLLQARRADAEKSGVHGPRIEENTDVQAPRTKDKTGVQASHTEKQSGVQALCTEENLKFDNSYFKDDDYTPRLLFIVHHWELNKKVKLPVEAIDKALLDDPEFRRRVHLYATDEDAFKRDYVVAHKKLSKPGLSHSSFFGSAFENSMLRLKNMPVTQTAVGVAIAAAVVIFSVFYVILGYFYEVNRRI